LQTGDGKNENSIGSKKKRGRDQSECAFVEKEPEKSGGHTALIWQKSDDKREAKKREQAPGSRKKRKGNLSTRSFHSMGRIGRTPDEENGKQACVLKFSKREERVSTKRNLPRKDKKEGLWHLLFQIKGKRAGRQRNKEVK